MYDLLNEFVVCMLDIKLWTGRKTLRPEDLSAGGIDINALPPGTLASLGSKRIIGQEALAPFSAIKREAEKLCLSVGTRFLGGYAIPNPAIDQLKEQLDALKIQYLQQRDVLCRHYDEEVETWIAENPPQWSSIIRAAVEPLSSVRRALQFSYTPVAIAAAEGLSCTALDEQLDGLMGQLCHEIRQQARTAYHASYRNKTQVTRKALRPIQAIRDKLCGLVFLDPLLAETLRAIDTTLEAVPEKGPLEGTTLNLLAGLLGRQLANLGRVQTADLEEDLEESNLQEQMELDLPSGALVCGTSALAWDF